MNKNMKTEIFVYRYLLGWVVSVACRYRHIAENEYEGDDILPTEQVLEQLSYFPKYVTSSNCF